MSCCVGKGPQCTVLSGTYNAVKMALIVASVLLVEEPEYPGETTDLSQVTDFYHVMLQVLSTD